MRRRSGNVLLEILIGVVIIAVIIAAITPFVKGMFFTEKTAGEEESALIFQVRGKGALKSDILYAGLGLPCRKGSCPALSFQTDGSKVIFRYEKDPDRKPAYGILECYSGNCQVMETNYSEKLKTTALDEDRSSAKYIGSFFFRKGETVSTSLGDGVYMAFGVKGRYNGCSYEGMSVGFPCVKVEYELQDDNSCPSGTRDLVRKTPNGNYVIYPCVSDVKVLVNYDSNGDGKIETEELWQERTITSVNDLERTRGIGFLILYTTGKRTNQNVSPSYVNGNPALKVSIDGKDFYLKLPKSYQGYDWKVAIITNIPENLIKRD